MNLAPAEDTPVYPDVGALTGSATLEEVAGALLTFTLIVAVLMLIVCGATWAIAASAGNVGTAAKARVGLFVALGGAVMAGGAMAWLNWLIDVGSTL
ncbi:MAG: hypothetical protein CMH34_11660 [Microbacterium sp.]|nr:hypothetical protein [Microbacterium sp.]